MDENNSDHEIAFKSPMVSFSEAHCGGDGVTSRALAGGLEIVKHSQ